MEVLDPVAPGERPGEREVAVRQYTVQEVAALYGVHEETIRIAQDTLEVYDRVVVEAPKTPSG